ncbi:uncharacterized mitochondrial protein AtMg00810-like [Hibiscus syriacus]|uniref:uncharacterized mitochondrial protein AtMg00810-like n=1 Tax=Hibiscus syriacus TaxID=106335 RepID=UPI0019234A1C|nr:uncharacterized mitochondrial protein AtMg00810-like [Hibiscus syriacus]
MVSTSKLSANGGKFITNGTKYRSIVGALQYAVVTHPNIAYSVNKVFQFMHAPCDILFQAVKRILRYLQDIADNGLRFTSSSRLSLTTFVDATWASDVDDRRSTSGFCIYFRGNLISWSSHKQQVVARSTAEAEYRSVASTPADLSVDYGFS